MRRLSARFVAALMAEQTDEDVIALVTIEHPALAAPLRLSSHADECFSIDPHLRGTTSRGLRYSYVPVEMTLPEDTEETPQTFELRLSNIGRETVALVRSATEPASVTVELVSRGDPEVVEAEFPDFELMSAEYYQERVTLGLGLDALAGEPYPADTFTPAHFPGAF